MLREGRREDTQIRITGKLIPGRVIAKPVT